MWAADGMSRNIGAFVKTAVPTGDFVFVSMPFHGFGDSSPRTITEAIGDQLTGTDGTVSGSDFIMKWDANNQGWVLFWKANNSGSPEWRDMSDLFNPTTNTIAPGEGITVQNNQTNVQFFYAIAEVPDTASTPTATITLVEGFTLPAYSYPNAIALNTTTLSTADGGTNGDIVSRWDIPSQAYVRYFYDSTNKWQEVDAPGTTTTYTLFSSESFFYDRVTNSSGSITWEEPKPYPWP